MGNIVENTNLKRKIGGLRQWFKKVDTAQSKYIRAATPYCVQCGTREHLTCGHLITRNCKSVRYDYRNCFTQCRDCNLRHEYNPELFTAWWLEEFGEEEYNNLVRDSKRIRKWTVEELKAIEKSFIDSLEQVTNGKA
jgi:hypothetical protein